MRDLERALERVDDGVWRAALELARELGIEAELAARLRRLPAGQALAQRLAITPDGSAYYNVLGAVNAGRAPRGMLTIANLHALPGARTPTDAATTTSAGVAKSARDAVDRQQTDPAEGVVVVGVAAPQPRQQLDLDERERVHERVPTIDRGLEDRL